MIDGVGVTGSRCKRINRLVLGFYDFVKNVYSPDICTLSHEYTRYVSVYTWVTFKYSFKSL